MIVDPLATAYDLIEKWLAFAEDDHTFNHIENHLITHEEDTNATVIDNQYLKKMEHLFKESQLFIDKVCKLCGGSNDHGSKCQSDDNCYGCIDCGYVVCVCKPVVNKREDD